jgi:hypothetical protein
MNNVIEKATSHFRNKISGSMKSLEVPEWETKIWFKSSSTLREESKILELSQQGKTVEALVESILIRARNEDGTKMFALADKAVFMNEIDPAIIIRIAGEINGVPMETLDEAEKN